MSYTTSLDPEEMRVLGARLGDLSERLAGLNGPRGSFDALGNFDLTFAATQLRSDAKQRAVEVADWVGSASGAVNDTTKGFEAADDVSGQAFESAAANVYRSADRED